MTEPAHVRAFIAVDLAPEVQAALARLKAALAQVRSEVRWVRDEGLHMTVKFLGEVATVQLDQVRDAVARAAASVPAFCVHSHGLGAFPSLKRPRVVWAGCAAAECSQLARGLDAVLAPLGFAAESRPFHPHVTLGRINGHRGWNAVETMLKLHWTDDFGISRVDHVTMYRSDLRPGGAIYTSLWTSRLADSTKGVNHGIG